MLSRVNSKLLHTVRRWYSSSRPTIFGLSSGSGKCGVAVVRVSGDACRDVMKIKTQSVTLPEPRKAVLRRIFHSKTTEMIDKGLVLWFPGPNSFTGEDSVEFHVHGGVAVVSAMYDSLGSIDGVRLAEPGEFTKRAFYAGKMDLTEVEGLADLIEAETEAQRKQAMLQANGELSKVYNELRNRLLRCIANIEAYIDFAEDQDVGDDVFESVKTDVASIIVDVKAHLNDQRRGERLRSGVRTVIIGAPNVGKSSFVNLLSNRKVSIVTNVAGTTRDIIESHHDIGGYPVILADTAGLRKETSDIIEHEGITRAKDYLTEADFIVLIVDAGNLQSYLKSSKKQFDDYLDHYVTSLGFKENIIRDFNCMIIINKVDLLSEEFRNAIDRTKNLSMLSCQTGEGLQNVLEKITENLKHLCGNPCRESPNISQQRYRHHLKACIQYLEKYYAYLSHGPNPDLAIATQYLRNAVRCIGMITGNVDTEEILDVIFRTFCIGK
ncbi:tRNA modification GTPase GTPBP3, mitochondrial [Aedes aegypti]|uniref:TrmE-type G domain-containing protein n=1 Tax=Aedes aegypti TaxID=7159 RepID=A0A1S4F6B0_AEDAE|nr:tRNA modification GTPase GTPBP3, mitochondrial [Aedes aegypti]XP_021707487.1 tRNA modification GTPase GTPBP3, mitochondrial [Aedes aegypti]